MAFKRKPYFYDNQIKRLLLQAMANFSGYTVMTGNQRDGKHRFLDVPIIYGDMDRVTGYVLQGGSENVMGYLPILSLVMTGMNQKAAWRQAPQHYEKFNYIEREMDADGQLVQSAPGKKKTVERFQPVPYDITLELSIWTSNYDQAYQLVEQIATVYNPDMDIQLSNSPADWSLLTSLIFEGGVRPEKAVPSGTETDPLYIHSMSFDVVLWLSPPAKVYDTTYIYEIQAQIKEIDESLDFDEYQTLDGCVIKADAEDIIFFESLGSAKPDEPEDDPDES